MVANTEPIFGLTANLRELTFVNADGTTPKDLFVAGSNGSKFTRCAVHSDDTALVNLKVYVHDGTTAYPVGVVRVAIGAGNDGAIASVNLLSQLMLPWLDQDGELFLPSGYKMQVGPLVAVTAAKTVTIVAIGVDY
jgi:hypothetical protein